MAESTYAPELRALGFRKLDKRTGPPRYTVISLSPMPSQEEIELADRFTPRIEPPAYLRVGGLISMTVAIDDVGGHWMAPYEVDLNLLLGFSEVLGKASALN